jgi:hypothetical protein
MTPPKDIDIDFDLILVDIGKVCGMIEAIVLRETKLLELRPDLADIEADQRQWWHRLSKAIGEKILDGLGLGEKRKESHVERVARLISEARHRGDSAMMYQLIDDTLVEALKKMQETAHEPSD